MYNAHITFSRSNSKVGKKNATESGLFSQVNIASKYFEAIVC